MYFDTESTETEPITVDKKYPGLRFYVTAHMDTIVHNMSGVLAYKPNLKLFSDEFAADKERIMRWKAFLKKIKWKEDILFSTVMQIIKDRLQPMAMRYWGK